MKIFGTMMIEVNVLEVKQFDRRSKERGQEIIIATDKGYRCAVQGPDVSVVDLTGLTGTHKFYIEPITSYDMFISSNDKKYSKNYPSFKIVEFKE